MSQRMLLHRALAKVHRRTDETLGRQLGKLKSTDGLRVSCRTGCAACCRQVVMVPVLEAMALLEHFMRTLDEEALRGLMRQCAVDAQALADPAMTGREWFRQQRQCLALKDNSCTVYAIRPTVCRTHVVFTPAALCDSADSQVAMADVGELRSLAFKTELGMAEQVSLPRPLVPLQYGLLVAWFIVRDAPPGWMTLRHTTAMQGMEGTAAWAHLDAGSDDEALDATRVRFGGALPTPYPIWEHLPVR